MSAAYWEFVVVCPLAYVLAGAAKFVINSIRAGRLAFDQIGLGRFPSTHTSIVSAAAWLIALKCQADTPAFAVAMALVLVVVIDAMDLRKKLEQVNRILKTELPDAPDVRELRDRVGHTLFEVLGGVATGAAAAAVVRLFG